MRPDELRPARASRPRRCAGSAGFLPKGLYARSLIIIIAPMVLLQSVIAYVFMERHWQTRDAPPVRGGDRRHRGPHRHLRELSAGPRRDDARRASPATGCSSTWTSCRDTDLPPPGPKPFFSILDETLSRRTAPADRPARSGSTRSAARTIIEIRVKLDDGVHARAARGAARPTPRTRTSSWSGWAARRWSCSASRSCSCATRSGRSCALPRPRRASARAARSSSARAARARCARPATPSSR